MRLFSPQMIKNVRAIDTCGGRRDESYWVQPGIATPPLRHSINQSEGKNAGVGSATFCHFWQSGKAFATVPLFTLTFSPTQQLSPQYPVLTPLSQPTNTVCLSIAKQSLLSFLPQPPAHFLRFSPMAIAIGVFCIRYAGGIVVDLACENCHLRVKNHCTSGGRKENLNRKEESNRKEGASYGVGEWR